MKEIQRICAVLLVLVMMFGALPMEAFAVAEYGSPTAEPEELVIDYGKSVMIELENLKKHIQLNGGATAPTLAGVITATGYANGQLLTSLPSVTGCKSANTSMTASYGTVERTSTHLTYTPTKFLTAIEYFYGVYSFTGFSKYLLVEIRVIPATQVYYEAENFVNTQIQTIHTTDGGKTNTPWTTENDNSGTGSDTQGYDPVGEPNFDVIIDRKNIPAGAFFADFDGTGNANRFSKDKVYGGNNFDSAACWFGSKGVDTDYIETTPGLLVIPTTEKDYHYVQTIISGKDGTSSPLALRPSRKDFLEVRFRTEGVKAKYVPTDPAASKEPILKMTLGLSSTANVGGDPLEVVLDYEALKSGEMITARVPLGNWDYYTKAEMIYKFRFYVNGILFNNGGKLIIDYLYIGASTEQAMIPEYVPTERKYLFFGFDEWTDKAYYDASAIDGDLDFSDVKNWYADYNSAGTTDGYGGFKLDPTYPGTITFKDGKTSGSGARYNLIQTGTSSNPANLKYVTTDTDYAKVRFKIEEGWAEGGSHPLIHVEYSLTGSASYTSSSGYACSISSDWQEITFDIGVARDNTIDSLRITFGWSQGCTFTIDYIAIYPSNLQQESQNYLFMDYGSNFAMSDYISGATYRPNTNVSLTKSDVGLVMEDTKLTEATTDNDNSTRVYCWIENLNLTPGANHYFQARIKIDPAGGASKVTATSKDGGNGPWFDFYFKNTADGGGYVPTSYRYPIDLSKDVGKWITVCIPITHSAYNTSNKIAKIVPALRGTQGAKVTIDYIYVGPPMTFATSQTINVANEANPAARALYFGFDNDTADGKRYQSGTYTFNDTYCNLNYDTGNNWATSGYYSNSTSDFTVNNTGGIVAVTAATKEVDGKTKGPYFVTTKTNGQFVVNADTQKSLKYHPQFAEVFQIRFRLNGCSLTTTKSQVPELIFLFGGYDQNGEFKYHENTAVYPYMTQLYHDTEEFQTVTVPLSKEIRNMSLITNLGVRFWRIQGGTIDIDYIYMGPASDTPYTKINQSEHKASVCEPHEVPMTETVYGYDEPYSNDLQLSNSKSMFVLGNGVRTQNQLNPTQYTEASFSFTGTGFDIISRTGMEQATVRVEVKNASDGRLMQGMSINCKGDMELYQIPTVSVRGLTYGNYVVTVGVNKKIESSYAILNRGNEFYLDAIRVYDTIYVWGSDATGSNLTKDQKIALNAYRMHKEAYGFVREIRDSLLRAEDFSSNKYTSGALFIDTKQITDGKFAPEDIQISEHLALNVSTYEKLGPKNEVYLSPGQAVAFKLNLGSGTPVGIDVGAKTILKENGSAVLAAGFVTSVNLDTQDPSAITKTIKTVNTATNLYYPLNISTVSSGSYLVLYNASTGSSREQNILSLTDLKISYHVEPTNLPTETVGTNSAFSENEPGNKREVAEAYSFEIDERVTEAAALFLGGFSETPAEEDTVAQNLSIYHSLNLASDISVNFLVPASELDAYDSFFMRIAVSDYEDNVLQGHSFLYPEAVRNGEYYYFTLSDLTAVQMMDELEATLYMSKDGKDYVSTTDIYSIADYAYGQLEKENAPESLKVLCADLLVYGGKAQLYKGYRTDALADAFMNEEQRAYCSSLDALSFGNTNAVGTESEAPAVTWAGKALELNSKVSVIYCVDLSNYGGEPRDLSLHVSYLDSEGETVSVDLRDILPYEGRENCYKFTLTTLLAAELRTVLTAQVYAGEQAVSNTLTYSADTYGNNKTGALGELCKALFAYSDSAKAYFAN